MYFVGTNLATHSFKIFCYEHTPKTPLIDAVVISASIPLYFPAKADSEGNCYVDGGVLLNYPIRLFDEEGFIENNELSTERGLALPGNYRIANKKRTQKVINSITNTDYKPNHETIGFRLDSEDEIHFFIQKKPLFMKLTTSMILQNTL